jgi:oligopeptide transport system permease protein
LFSLILQRLFTAIPVLLAVVTLTFVMVHSAPGGPFDEDKAVSPEVMEKLNERYNLNAPLFEQYTD